MVLGILIAAAGSIGTSSWRVSLSESGNCRKSASLTTRSPAYSTFYSWSVVCMPAQYMKRKHKVALWVQAQRTCA